MAFLSQVVASKWESLGVYRYAALTGFILVILLIITATDRLLWQSHLESWHYRAQMSRLITQSLSRINKDWSVEIVQSQSVGYLEVSMPIIKFFNQEKMVFTAKARGNLDLVPHIFSGYGLITLSGRVYGGGAFNLVHRMNLSELWKILSDFSLPVPELFKISIRDIPETVLWGLWPALKTSRRLSLTDIKLSGFGVFQRGKRPFRMEMRPGRVHLRALGGTLALKIRSKPIKIECQSRQCELLESVTLSPAIGEITIKKGIFYWDRKIKGNDLMLHGQWTPTQDRSENIFASILGCALPIKSRTWSISGDFSKPTCSP